MPNRSKRKKAQRAREVLRAIEAQREVEAQMGVRQAIKRAVKAATRRTKCLLLNGMNAAQHGVELCHESKLALNLKMLYFMLVLCCTLPIFVGWIPTDDWPFDISVGAVIAVPVMLYVVPLFVCFASNYIYYVAWKWLLIFWPRWIISYLVREKSLRDYVSQNQAVKTHTMENGDNILICTKAGLLLWMGFLNVIIDAHKCNKSWCGSFSDQHLKMIGSHCRIAKSPTASASFKNLLLDFSRLATLLLPYYSDTNGIAEMYVQQLYDSMTNPPVNEKSSKSEQDSFIKYLSEHLALCSARHRKLLLGYICKFVKAFGPGKKKQFRAALRNINIPGDWRPKALRHPLLAKVLLFDRNDPGNTVYRYGKKAHHLFRFMRNFFEHGGDSDFFTGQQYVRNMEDLDHIGVELFCSFVVQLSYEIHRRSGMVGVLEYAWKSFGV